MTPRPERRHGWRPVTDIPGSPAKPPRVSERYRLRRGHHGHRRKLRVSPCSPTGTSSPSTSMVSKIWCRNLGVPDNPYGHASSLVIYENLLLVQYDHTSRPGPCSGSICATARPAGRKSAISGRAGPLPLILEHDGTPQVVLSAASAVVSYDPRTGDELWRVACLKDAEVACTPVYSDGFIYVAADYASVVAIDLSRNEIAWEHTDLVPGVATPLVVGSYF